MNQPRVKEVFFIIALSGLLGAFSYAKSFQAEFQLDDNPVIVRNAYIKHLEKITDLFSYDPTRFITHLTFALQYYLHKTDLFFFHCINLLIHIVCAFLVYYLVFLILQLSKANTGRDPGGNRIISLFSALIFLTHPLQTQAVTYIVQRSTLLATLFYILSLILYLHLREKRHGAGYGALWLVIFLGAMSKPIFVTLPFMVLALEHYLFKISKQSLKENSFLLLPYFSVLFLVPFFLVLFQLNYMGQSFDLSRLNYATSLTPEISRWEYFLTELRVVVTYIRLLFVPAGQNLDYDFAVSRSFFEPQVVLSFAFLAAILVWGVFPFKRKRVISLGIAWFFIALIAESSVFPIPDVIFEHRLYLPMVGFALFLSAGLYEIFSSRKRYIVFGAVTIMSFSLLTCARNALWADRIALLEDTVRKSPHKARTHNNLGIVYQEKGYPGAAEEEYKKAVAVDPRYVNSYSNLGKLYAALNKFDLAKEQFSRALAIEPWHYEANLNLGIVYYQLGKFDLAAAQYKKAINVNPKSDKAYLNLGIIYAHMGNFGDAEANYQKALSNNPYFALGYRVLAELYFSQGLYDKSIGYLKKAITLEPQSADVYNILGIAYVSTEDHAQAEWCFKRAIELDADLLPAYLNLAHFYKISGRPKDAEYFREKAERMSGSIQNSVKKTER